MTHHIVVIGAGYAGLTAANRLARRLSPGQAQVTLVNAAGTFLERVRLHQVAAGQAVPEPAVTDLARGARFVRGRVESITADRRELRLGSTTMRYDTLVYAAGSVADLEGAPGVAEHALTVSGTGDTTRLRDRVARIPAGGVLTVVGAGPTGIEVAAELAESHRRLRVRLLAAEDPGGRWSPAARAHLRRAFDRLGVEVMTGAKVVRVDASGARLADGRSVGSDAVVWAAGFRAPALAREAGLAVDGHDRVLVDRTARSISHPDVYAVGDAAAVRASSGQELRMACATALPAGRQAADAIADRINGREPGPLRFRYVVQCVSLGRRDGLIQFVHADDRPRAMTLTGRSAALVKELVVRNALRSAQRGGG
ncbi:FAD-dependent oxidoreductase [Planomonospora alba]|uniref:FAD-dependent oxidoreductase n=1 Tax=Planomonospora alba TaxID=161354 RepID=A0ABP6MRI6_9ACTN